jgi:probable HAF family extracellular repeat protein
LFDNGKLTSLAPEGEYLSIGGINDQGTLVGDIAPSINHPTRAVKWENGQMTYLSTLGGAVSAASHLNNAGQIVGGASLSDGSQHPVLWENDQIIDLGNPFGGKGGSAVDINENRQIIGNYMNSSGNEAAFFWENGQMKDLGDLGGDFTWARAINDSAQIVGVSVKNNDNNSRAVLWDEGKMLDLNNLISENSGWELLFAQDINNKGQIVGYGYFNGEERGFLLNPIEDKPEPKSVPESTPTLGLLGLGMLGINSLRKRLQNKEN